MQRICPLRSCRAYAVVLFAVGAVLCAQRVSISCEVIINVFSKNIVLPSIILCAMFLLGLLAVDSGLVSVTLAIPTASIAVIFAVEYKTAEREIASTLFWSTDSFSHYNGWIYLDNGLIV